MGFEENPEQEEFLWEELIVYDLDKIVSSLDDHQFAANHLQNRNNLEEFLAQNLVVFMKVKLNNYNNNNPVKIVLFRKTREIRQF